MTKTPPPNMPQTGRRESYDKFEISKNVEYSLYTGIISPRREASHLQTFIHTTADSA
jgi:hypothetical protein